MKLVLLIIALSTSLASLAQEEALQSLVDAEKSFARTAKEKSTKEAFVTFFSDSGFIFQAGPVLGKKFWQEAQAGTELLSWEPVFASIAASGDFGYTTGPWEFRQHKEDANPVANGYFVSVWKKENNDWKVLLDIGVSFPATASQKETFHSSLPAADAKTKDAKKAATQLLDKEQEFITAQHSRGWPAYETFIAKDARIYRPGSFPFITAEQKQQLYSETDKKFSYEKTDAVVAPSGDLGYVYGKTVVQVTKEGNTRSMNGNYLRIWRKETAGNWKIVLDLVNIPRG